MIDEKDWPDIPRCDNCKNGVVWDYDDEESYHSFHLYCSLNILVQRLGYTEFVPADMKECPKFEKGECRYD